MVGAMLAIACVDMSAPRGPASISLLQLPSPSVVIHDVMRDSLGNPKPLSVIAYDANGSPLAGQATQFFITDSAPRAHLTADGVLTGDTLGTVHIVAQVGNLQTPATEVAITVAPTTFALAPRNGDTLKASFTADSANPTAYGVPATVTGANGAAAQGFIVQYALQHVPSSSTTLPAVYLGDDANNPSSVDTSDATGRVSRNISVVTARLADQALLSGQKTDSVVVIVQAKYNGTLVPPSPIRLVIPFKVGAALP
jgi:hypothetical protein